MNSAISFVLSRVSRAASAGEPTSAHTFALGSQRANTSVGFALGLALTVMGTACQTPAKDGADGGKAEAGADEGKAEAGKADEGKADAPKQDGPKLGKFVDGGPVPWTQLLRKSPEEVEKIVGAPKENGEGRVTCVRWVPEKVYFSCEQEIRLYDTEKFDTLSVEYEDGKAANVFVVGFQEGEGEVTPQNALDMVGLELPVEGRRRDLEGEATVWEWFNSLARLKIGEDQFMVRLSTVQNDWKRAKLEVIVNSPLTDDEKSRVKEGGAPTPTPTEPAGGQGGDPSKPETVLQPPAE